MSSTRPRTRRSVVWLVAALTVATAATWLLVVNRDNATAEGWVDGLAASTNDSGIGPNAVVMGVVSIDDAVKCVTLIAPEDGVVSAVVWPAGTRVLGSPPRIELANGTEIHDGDFVVGTGGAYPATPNQRRAGQCAEADSTVAFVDAESLRVDALPAGG